MVAAKKTKKIFDMTHGPLFGKIVLFVLPLMATNLLQTFYNAADMMIVSLSTEQNAVGAIGVTSSMIHLVLNLFIGLSVGGNVVVARRLGAGDAEGASRAVHTTLLLGALMGVLGTAVGLAITRPALSLMGAEADVLKLAVTYTLIYFAGTPFLALTNFATAIFRAKGDSRTPLIVLTATGLLNVLLNLFFVLAVGLSVEGVAIATSVSNAVSTVVLLLILAREKGACRFSLRRLRPDGKSLRDIVYIGVPAGIQSALISFSNVIIQSSILQVNNAAVPAGETYAPVVAGNAAASNLENFAYTATDSVYQASVTFTGQNAGAGEYKRVWRVMGCCYLLTSLVGMLFGWGILLARAPLLALYGIHNTAGTLEALAFDTAVLRFRFLLTVYAVGGCMNVGSGILRGLGKSLTSTVISLSGLCLFRVVWITTAFRAFPTMECIYISYPVSWFITTVAALAVILVTLRKRTRN